ncbi:MAG: TRIC cation channel family protein [Sulfurimonadaceae bacterium]|jgi:uncharacterized membrane protein YeiH|nr:TRIC cation channel family protein [Sulfurimonadaceae bacterium]
MPEFFLYADILGIIAFSISGFLIAIKNKLDILGILIASTLTALGGGVLRDTILSNTPFAFSSFYPAATVVSILTIIFIFKLYKQPSIERQWVFVISDTVGLVAFSITGAILAINAEYNFFGIVILSFITAVGGGVIRDIMINQVPSVLISDFYGSIAVIAAIVLGLLNMAHMLNELSILCVALFCVALRLLAVKLKWHLPTLN